MTKKKNWLVTAAVLAAPIILQNMITFGVALADNLMVGQLGENAVAGLYLGTQVHAVLQIMLGGLGSAIIILSSQYWGQRNCRRIKEVVAIAMRFGAGGSAAVAAACVFAPAWLISLFTDDAGAAAVGAEYLQIVGFSYLFFGIAQLLITAMRSVEMVSIGLINSLVALAVNVTLNYLLIFGHCGFPALGVRGAAIGTLISRAAELAAVLYFVFRVDPNLRMRPGDFLLWDKDIFHDLCRYGWPLLAGNIVWAVNNFVQTMIVGQMSAPVIAGVSIAGMLDRLAGMGIFGLAEAVGIITGKMIGAGEEAGVRDWARKVQLLFISLGVVCGASVYFFHREFMALYVISPETAAITETLMLVLAAALVGRCYQAPCLMGLVKAGGDTSFVFKNDTIFVFGVVLPAAFIAERYLHAAPWVVYACLLSDQILKCFVAVVKINSFNWMKKLARS